jgi:hypothetical protein
MGSSADGGERDVAPQVYRVVGYSLARRDATTPSRQDHLPCYVAEYHRDLHPPPHEPALGRE